MHMAALRVRTIRSLTLDASTTRALTSPSIYQSRHLSTMSTNPLLKAPLVEDKTHWDDIWAKGLKPGELWDIGKAEPELSYELSLRDKGTLGPLFEAQKARKVSALVPGCGRGYAVKELAEFGFHAVGADISESAMENARTVSSHPNARYLTADFFKEDIGKFDLVYDSTFLCAIPPTMWLAWGERMGNIVAPNGYIAMHVYPVAADPNAPEVAIDGSSNEPGPPHRVTLKLIRSLLANNGFEEVVLRHTPEERVTRGHKVMHGIQMTEYFMVWRKMDSGKTQ